MSISSPCVDICKLDGDGICVGCFRDLNEIARWSGMTEDEKLRVIFRIAAEITPISEEYRDKVE